MTKAQATAQVFWMAFQVLPRKEQEAVLQHILKDKSLREDLIDLAIIESRRAEPARPLRDILKNSRRAR